MKEKAQVKKNSLSKSTGQYTIGKNKSAMSENSSNDTFKKYWNQFFGKS